MDLNTIKLPVSEIINLYKKTLVDFDEKPTSHSEINTATSWKYLGENKKNNLVILRYQHVIHLPDKQLSFLTKLLSACNLSLGDVAIINFHHYDASQLNEIINFFKPKTTLLFGIDPIEIGMPMKFPEFQVQHYRDIKFVSSPSLETIEPDKSLKGNLWIALKKIYNL